MQKGTFITLASLFSLGLLSLVIFTGPFSLYNKKSSDIRSKAQSMRIASSVFKNNESIPAKYTCDGENINPPLLFLEVPDNAKSLALIMDDPDAPMGTWDHWVVYNINPEVSIIKENFTPESASIGFNSSKKAQYQGPCPPSGTHRYFFKLYALNTLLPVKKDATKKDIEEDMKTHIIAQAEFIGLYQRK